VTVKRGFSEPVSGMTLAEDRVFSFQTEPKPSAYEEYSCVYLSFARSIYNFYSHEVPLISVYTDLDENEPVNFSLYRYASEEEFKNDIYLRDDRPYWCIHYNKPISIEGKEQILSMDTNFMRYGTGEYYYYQARYIVLPESLPEGYYIAVMKADALERRALIQINDMAVYVGAASNKTIGMVYDSQTSLPVKGAQIVFDSFSMTAGSDGVAVSEQTVFDEESSYAKNYAVRREGHPTYFSTFERRYSTYNYYYGYYDDEYYYYRGFATGDIQDNIWGYLFTDRDIYALSDTINLWGVVKGKDGGKPPRKVTISLEEGYSYYNQDQYTLIEEKEADISDLGTFKASLSYQNLSPGSYTLSVKSDGEVLMRKSFWVDEYEKPVYNLKTSLDKNRVVYGEKVNFTLESKFFEGTPVNGMKFNYYINGLSSGSGSGVLETDENGLASLDLTATCDTESWNPQSAYISVSNADPEETNVYGSEWLTIFPRDTMIRVESETDDQMNCSVKIRTNKIDISKIGDKVWYTTEDYAGVKTSVSMTAQIFKVYYTAKQTGTYYDFINKVTYPTYEYEKHEESVDIFDFDTVGGEAVLTFTKEENCGYYIVIRCVDGKGRPITHTQRLYEVYIADNSYYGRLYDYYSLETGDAFSDFAGEEIDAVIHKNGKAFEKPENARTLFMLYRKGLVSYALTDDITYAVRLLKEYIPNISIEAVYFDGKYMHSARDQVRYDYDNSQLNIEVTPDGSEYAPGDTVTLNIRLTDKEGKGRSGEVAISVVDEAFFALFDQSVHMLSDIYGQSVSTGYLSESIPHSNTLEDYYGFEGGEGAEGGDEGVRTDFVDTAVFDSITIDSSGRGTFSFKLPDNLTQWRITYLGVTDDLCAGNGAINIDTRLPYFVTTVFNDVFISGDKPVIQARSFGTAISGSEQVEYTLEVTKDGQPWHTYSATAAGNKRALIPLDALEEGTYTYILKGSCGSYKDAVQYEFQVLPGFNEQPTTQYDTLTEDIDFPEIKWPAELYFYNSSVRSYWDDLIDLSYSWGKRIDNIIVRKQARALLEEYFGPGWSYGVQNEYDTTGYQLYDGGIALLPYASSDPVLTAKICALNDPDFDYETMKSYFYKIKDLETSTSSEVAAAYWGLACLREPVLLELNELAKTPNLPIMDRMYIGLAYAYSGDIGSAREIYDSFTARYLREDSRTAYIFPDEEGYDSDEIQEATSLCALLAYKVNADKKQKLFEYVSNMYSEDILTNAVRLSIIKTGLRTVSMESSFTFELDGRKETVTLKGIETYSMFLTADKLSSIRFDDIQGDITVSTIYTKPVGETAEVDDRISITRKYLNRDGEEVTAFSPSEYVKVVLNVQFDQTAPSGFYLVEDYLPASLIFVSPHSAANEWVDSSSRAWYTWGVMGQKVAFYVYHRNDGSESRTIEYFARVNNIGDFTADSAVISNLESNMVNYSSRARVSVK